MGKGAIISVWPVGSGLNKLTGTRLCGFGEIVRMHGDIVVLRRGNPITGDIYGDDEYWEADYIITRNTLEEAYREFKAYYDGPNNWDIRS